MTYPDPDPDPIEQRYAHRTETRRRAWGAIPSAFALALIGASLTYAVRYDEVGGYLFAAFVAAIGVAFLWRKGAPDRSGGQ